jgi:transcriptional regulator with XRE-family HTH domain
MNLNFGRELTSGHDWWCTWQSALVSRLDTIGEAIRILRRRRGMTQKQLGEAVGLTKGRISQIESGGTAPPMERMERFAEALGCDLVVEIVPRGAGHPAELGSSLEGVALQDVRQVARLARIYGRDISPEDRSMLEAILRSLEGRYPAADHRIDRSHSR